MDKKSALHLTAAYAAAVLRILVFRA